MMIECNPVDDNSPIRQGDIFYFYKQLPPWNKYCIVITADCDIAYDKSAGLFSYCPITDIETYFYYVYVSDLIDINKVLVRIKSIISKLTGGGVKDNTNIDLDAINKWAKEISPEECLKQYKTNDVTLHDLLEFLHNFVVDNSICNKYVAYMQLMNGITSKEGLLKKLVTRFGDHIKKLPGDLFYINYISGLDRIGYIVNLRRISAFSQTAVNVSMKRISHMSSPFRYRLTQQVGQMFSDIGLPDEYEANRKEAVEEFIKTVKII
jgi:hypothetical protein